MSAHFGDAVSCSVLYAVKLWVDGGSTGTLDPFFQQVYSMLRTSHLEPGTNTPRGYSDLTPLQTLIESGSLQVTQTAFDCELFRRVGKWFLTHERDAQLSDADADLAQCLLTFVVNKVSTWHTHNPSSLHEIEESRNAWLQLLQIMGPFRYKLQSVELIEETNGSDVIVKIAEDGLLFELWAVSCPVLSTTVIGVRNCIATGNPRLNADEGDEN